MFNFFRSRNQSPNAHVAELAGWLSYPLLMDSTAGGVLTAMLSETSIAAPQPDEQANGLAGYHVIGDCAQIEIKGMILPEDCWYTRAGYATSCDGIMRAMKQAVADPNVAKIKLLVDSPGGIALRVAEASDVIFQSRGSKPIVAHVVGCCCSAAYWLASSADRIVADPSTWTGSVGAIRLHADYSKRLEELGIVVSEITHGQHKADGSPYRPLDEQGRTSLQERITAVGEMFDSAVARNRDVSVEDVANRFGQGKSFIAATALEVGLIDGITSTQGSNEGIFEMTQTPDTKPAETTDEVKPDEAIEARFVKLETAFAGFGETLNAISAKLNESTETETEEETNDKPEEKSEVVVMLEKVLAKLDHKASSSDEPATGTTEDTSEKPSLYRMRKSA